MIVRKILRYVVPLCCQLSEILLFQWLSAYGDPPSFPTRRSSDLPSVQPCGSRAKRRRPRETLATRGLSRLTVPRPAPATERDRKSTRLNSSHVRISYAVFR